jgi:colanic acid/amylovoran biosynthesis glycosyltransferase
MKAHYVSRQSGAARRPVALAMHRHRTVTRAARMVGSQPLEAPLGSRQFLDPLLAMHTPRVVRENRAATVGYVIDSFPRSFHGFVMHEILALERSGVDVHVFSLGMPEGRLDDVAMALARLQNPVAYFLADTEAGNGDDRTVEPPGRGMTGRIAHWLARQVSVRRIEHLHAHGAGTAADVVREASRQTGRPYSFTAYASDLQDRIGSSVREKFLEAQFAVALSDYDYNRLVGICGRGAADKLHRIPMSVDPLDYAFTGRAHLRHAILTVGPLVEQSGFVDLIEAMRLLRDRGVSARATIVGEGEFEAALRARIARYGLGGQIEIRPQASARELAAMIQTHTVMVLPWAADHGDRDALANLVLDAMAAGLPVLATDGPSIRELIDDGLNGRVLNAQDPLGLAGALETYFSSCRLRESVASNARTTVERAFAVTQNVAHLADLFSGTVAETFFNA